MKNKSDIKIMLKEAGILFAITLVAGLLLGFVYELTKEPIAKQKQLAIEEACGKVFAQAESFEETDFVISEELNASLKDNKITVGTIYNAMDAEHNLLGYVIETTSSAGYGGNIVIYTGITIDGKINDISILEISETAGLGMKAGDVLVPQFHEKNAAQFTYTKNGAKLDTEIDAIGGATITTKAVTNAVNGAVNVFDEISKGGIDNE